VTAAVTIIGGGLAGCEAAWQLGRRGVPVRLHEQRPGKSGPAHHTSMLAELVCSNSLRGAALENAVGLLKEELARLDSLIVGAARAAAVPAGGALAVDREQFSGLIESRLRALGTVEIVREEATAIPPEGLAIVACGPLPSEALAAAIDRLVGGERLHYYDAAAPIVAAESIEPDVAYRKSRYDKGDGADYLNLALDRDAYQRFIEDLRQAPRHDPKGFETDAAGGKIPYFEGCLPIEELAVRGEDALRFGPLKPVGLRDPRTGKTPYAVVQLRNEDVAGTALNLVGFQTRMTWPAQREIFGRLPGLANAEWLRLGVMHRNTFIDSPRLLDASLQMRSRPGLYFAGQITGAEGYVEAAACGAISGIAAARSALGLAPVDVPADTALGAVIAHLQNSASPDFQPANVTWTWFSPPDGPPIREKRARRAWLAARALGYIDRFAAGVAAHDLAAI
jgi:methylenetetrahydrofolate--tRNA-(uracil-5-)-methyltransferase